MSAMIKLKLLVHTTFSAKTPSRHFFRRLTISTFAEATDCGEFRYSCKVQMTSATPVDHQPRHYGQGEGAGNANQMRYVQTIHWQKDDPDRHGT